MIRRPPIFENQQQVLEYLEKQVPFLQGYSVIDDDLFGSAKEIVFQIFPEWKNVNLHLSQCTEGITNKLENRDSIDSPNIILLRCYGHGTESIINRKSELINLLTLSATRPSQIGKPPRDLGIDGSYTIGPKKSSNWSVVSNSASEDSYQSEKIPYFSPPLYARFANGFCYGYIEGTPLTPEDMVKNGVGRSIARWLAKFHKLNVPYESKEPMLWVTLRKYLSQVPKVYKKESVQKLFSTTPFLNPLHILNELELLQQALESQVKSPVVFCHNDLLAPNIIFRAFPDLSDSDYKNSDLILNETNSTKHIGMETEGQVAFIDFEYGCYSYRGFDIGNHFNEYAGFECNYNNYPSEAQQKTWLNAYLTAFYEEPTESQVTNLYKEVNKFSLASHFYWAIWALVQANVSDIDFDYMGYAILRFEEYYKRKNEMLAL